MGLFIQIYAILSATYGKSVMVIICVKFFSYTMYLQQVQDLLYLLSEMPSFFWGIYLAHFLILLDETSMVEN